MNLHPFRPS